MKSSLILVISTIYYLQSCLSRQDRDIRVPLDIKGVSIIPTISLFTVPSEVPREGQVLLFWKDVPNPSHQDTITVSCGFSRNLSDVYSSINVRSTLQTLNASAGSTLITALPMMRCDYIFRYVRFSSQSGFYVVKEITVRTAQHPDMPAHGHIALTSNENEMVVMFNSASNRQPEVRYGIRSEDLNLLAIGTSTTYRAQDMCHAPATTENQEYFRNPGYMHRVVLQNLEPSQTYYYAFGNGIDGWNGIHSFRSRPPLGYPFTKFLAYGDMGTFDASKKTAQSALSHVASGYDGFLLHFGDISYAIGRGSIWDTFFQMIEPYATHVPYMVSIGNHEYDYMQGGEKDPSGAFSNFRPEWGNYGSDSGGECAVPMYHRFSVPNNGNSLFWYSFNYGNVHVIQMSTEHNFTRGSPQYTWIENDLGSVDRAVTPWIILTGHRMMYATETNEDADIKLSTYFRLYFEDLLFQYEVNLMLVGHQHSYERSCNVYRGICRQDGRGTVHIVAGSAGYELDNQPFSPAIGNWSIVNTDEYGLLRIESTAEELYVQFVLTRNMQVYDEIRLRRWPSYAPGGMPTAYA